MTAFAISQAAELLGVSDDTVRRWVEAGRISAVRQKNGRLGIDGAELARFAQAQPELSEPGPIVGQSARNRFTGVVTRVLKDGVMAQVELQAGRHRVVSLMSREAADELHLEPGVLAVAAVKATNVVIEVPQR